MTKRDHNEQETPQPATSSRDPQPATSSRDTEDLVQDIFVQMWSQKEPVELEQKQARKRRSAKPKSMIGIFLYARARKGGGRHVRFFLPDTREEVRWDVSSRAPESSRVIALVDSLVSGNQCSLKVFEKRKNLYPKGVDPNEYRIGYLDKLESVKDDSFVLPESAAAGTLTELEHADVSKGRADHIPTPESILLKIESVQGPILTELNRWLGSFEGTTLEPDGAQQTLEEIRSLTAKAGCELLFQGQTVSLTCSASQRSKTATIRLFSAGKGPSSRLYSKSAFPPLSARSIPFRQKS